MFSIDLPYFTLWPVVPPIMPIHSRIEMRG